MAYNRRHCILYLVYFLYLPLFGRKDGAMSMIMLQHAVWTCLFLDIVLSSSTTMLLTSFISFGLYRGTLYTLCVNDAEKVQKLRQTVPENLIVDVDAKH
jgi:hypothetical protein